MVTTVAANAGAGTGASASLSASSDDTGGEITLNTGTSPSTATSFLTVTYDTPLGTPAKSIHLQRADQASNLTNLATHTVINSTVNGFDVGFASGGAANFASITGLKYYYTVVA